MNNGHKSIHFSVRDGIHALGAEEHHRFILQWVLHCMTSFIGIIQAQQERPQTRHGLLTHDLETSVDRREFQRIVQARLGQGEYFELHRGDDPKRTFGANKQLAEIRAHCCARRSLKPQLFTRSKNDRIGGN